MRRNLCLVLLLLFFLHPIPSLAVSSPIVLAYYPSWADWVLKPSQINYKLFTHIAHAFLGADATGKLNTEGNVPSEELTSLAHAAGVKVILSLGGQGSGHYFNPMARDPEAVKRYINAVVELVAKYKYDGVDLDWEAPHSAEDHRNYVSFTLQLKQALTKSNPQALLTMALDAAAWQQDRFHNPKFIKCVDFINVMTYDRYGPWSRHGGHISPLYPVPDDPEDGANNNASESMQAWVRSGWPKEKLVLGIACYARGFAVDQWYDPQEEHAAHEDISYRDVLQLLTEGWERKWEDHGKVPYLEKKGVKELISYEDPDSAVLKAEWAKKQGFRGIFFWEMSQDYINSNNAIIEPARDKFLK